MTPVVYDPIANLTSQIAGANGTLEMLRRNVHDEERRLTTEHSVELSRLRAKNAAYTKQRNDTVNRLRAKIRKIEEREEVEKLWEGIQAITRRPPGHWVFYGETGPKHADWIEPRVSPGKQVKVEPIEGYPRVLVLANSHAQAMDAVKVPFKYVTYPDDLRGINAHRDVVLVLYGWTTARSDVDVNNIDQLLKTHRHHGGLVAKVF